MNPLKQWARTASWGIFLVKGKYCAAAWTSKGLSALVLPRKTRKEALRGLHEYLPPLPAEFWDKAPSPVPQGIQTQTRNSLKGKPFRWNAFDISFLTPFQQRILKSTCQIPRGQVRTYGWVARKSGSPKGFRAAGQALTRNPVPIFIPCHRVIAGGNRLGGYGSGVDWKIRLLKGEGVTVNEGLVLANKQ